MVLEAESLEGTVNMESGSGLFANYVVTGLGSVVGAVILLLTSENIIS